MLKRFFLDLKGLSDTRVVSSTKKEYGLAVYFLWILMESLVLIFDTWFWAIFMIKKWVDFSLASFGILKYDWVMKTREIFNFLSLRNNSVTIEPRFLLLTY